MKTKTSLPGFRRVISTLTTTVVCTAVLPVPIATGAIIWNGPTIAYTEPGTDPTQPTNQDRLTPNVWLTRGGTQGLFNAKQETSYTHNFSPKDTAWAFGELSSYASLSYTDWEDLFGGSSGGGPPSLIGKDVVVHLISEDIYLSVTLTNWSAHGGSFSYVRSTPAVAPEPPALSSPAMSGDGTFQLTFTNTPGYNFTVLGTTNLSLALNNWDVLGQATYAPAGPGSYQFTDPGAGTNQPQRFYLLRWP